MAGARVSLNGLLTTVTRRVDQIRLGAEDIVADFAHDGERDMEQVIQNAITPTGLERVATGGATSSHASVSPGRIDSGLMINSVSSETYTEGNTAVGRFGWTKEVEDYFLMQEDGTQYVEAMHALSSANIRNREIALGKIGSLVRGTL